MAEFSSIRAVFTRPFNYTSRKRNAGWSAMPSSQPQAFPREFIEAAISAGCAAPVRKKPDQPAVHRPQHGAATRKP